MGELTRSKKALNNLVLDQIKQEVKSVKEMLALQATANESKLKLAWKVRFSLFSNHKGTTCKAYFKKIS